MLKFKENTRNWHEHSLLLATSHIRILFFLLLISIRHRLSDSVTDTHTHTPTDRKSKMIQPLYALVFGEVAVILVLLFRTPLRKPLLMLLDRLKQGRGPVVATTAGGTLFVIMVSLLYNITTIQTRTVEAGAVNPTDQVLLANQLLEASLLGKKEIHISLSL